MDQQPQPGDGPVAPDSFRWHGRLIDGLRPKAWGVVSACWESDSGAVSWEQLAEDVWRDHVLAEQYDHERLQSAVRDANAFFRRAGLPWHLSVKSGFAKLRNSDSARKLPEAVSHNSDRRTKLCKRPSAQPTT